MGGRMDARTLALGCASMWLALAGCEGGAPPEQGADKKDRVEAPIAAKADAGQDDDDEGGVEEPGKALPEGVLGSGELKEPKPDPGEIKAAEEGCNAGVLELCFTLAELRLRNADNPEMAATALIKACEGGLKKACERLEGFGRVTPEGQVQMFGGTGQQDVSQLEAQLKDDCDKQGKALACNDLALLYVRAPRGARNYESARTYFLKACDGGNTEGCNNLGYMYEIGDGVQKDHNTAQQLYTTSCDNDNMDGCAKLGFLLISGPPEIRHFDRAEPILTKACEADNLQGCTNLGILMASRPASADKAKPFLDKACEGNYARGCTTLGLMFFYGDGVEKSTEQAIAHFTKGCEGRHSGGCVELGKAYEKGEGVTADRAKALEFYEKGCQIGSVRGCESLDKLRAGAEAP